MRIDRLDLIAYGPFSGVTLDLSGGCRGLHIIYGPNEAGKSTALRALRGWLFGFPTQLGDNYKHSYQAIRVGGVLRDEDGKTFESIRRKASKRTLRAANDESDADEDLLKVRLLGGISQDDFNLMLSIDFKGLASGGEVFKSGGKLAELLFGSGIDLAAMRKFENSLKEELDSLFKPSGRIPSINKTILELEEKRREIEAASIKGTDWLARNEELAELIRRREQVDQEWREIAVERDRLRRIIQSRPDLARRASLKSELMKLADAPRLASDFPERRRKAEEAQFEATVEIKTRADECRRHQLALDALPFRSPILDDADAIDAIQAQLVIEQQAARNRLIQERDRAEHLKRATALLGELGRDESPDEAKIPRFKSGLKTKLTDLAGQWIKNSADREATERNVRAARKQRDAARELLENWPEIKDVESLQGALERTRTITDSSIATEASMRDLDKLVRHVKSLGARLIESGASNDAITCWPVPSLDVLERYRDEFQVAEAAILALNAELSEAEDQLSRIKKDIERQRVESDVPDLSTLERSRSQRDMNWRLVKVAWLGSNRVGETIAQVKLNSSDLIESFENTTRAADEIADRLRISANEVAIRAGYLADQAHISERIGILTNRRNEAVSRWNSLQSRWIDLWVGVPVTVRTPREMIPWANQHLALVEKIEQVAESQDRLKTLEEQRACAIDQLHRELVAIDENIIEGEDLASVRDRANAVLGRSQAERSRRESAEKALDRLNTELDQAMERLASLDELRNVWQKSWNSVIEPLGIPAEVTPQDALVMLENQIELGKNLDAIERISSDIREADHQSIRFTNQLAALLAIHAPDVPASPAIQATERLSSLLKSAREIETNSATLSRLVSDAQDSIQKANQALERSRLTLEALAREAGIKSILQLAVIEQLALDRSERERALREVEGRLVGVAAGISLDELTAEVAGIPPEEETIKAATLDEEFARLDADRHELSKLLGEKNQEVKTMAATAREARAELATTEREHLMGLLESDVERYVHLRLSLAVLRGAIEEYRNQNEAPVLRRASQHFARFTLGSFAGLRAELDDKNESVLCGIRADGITLVGIEGMSIGTVDQLYLSMKLASMEHYFQSRPPLPLVVDDLLVQFDDARATAALEALVELSRTTQILFFTHHEHLIHLAETRLATDRVFVHRLDRRMVEN